MNLYFETVRMIEVLEQLETNYTKYLDIVSKLESISEKTRFLEERTNYNFYQKELHESIFLNKSVMNEYSNLLKNLELIIDLYWSAERKVLNNALALPISIENRKNTFEIERISLSNPGIYTDNWIDSLIIGGRKEKNE